MSSMSRDVSSLVVRVDGNIQPHELDKLLIVPVSEQVGEIGRVVSVLVDGWELAISKDIAEDSAGDIGELGNEVHRVFEGCLPVLALVDSIGVCLGECGVVVELGASVNYVLKQAKSM